MVRIVAGVARCDPLGAQRATIQAEAQRSAQRPQTFPNEQAANQAQHIAQQRRNTVATDGPSASEQMLRTGSSAAGAESRRSKALAMLDGRPMDRYAVIAEAGDPAIVGVAVRSVAYGEIEIPGERYDAIALLALMDRYATANRHLSDGLSVPAPTLAKGFR